MRRSELSLEEIALRLGVSEPDKLMLQIVEREHVWSVLDACNWNRSLAAKALGIYRRTLQRKLNDYQIKRRPRRPVEKKKRKPKRRHVDDIVRLAHGAPPRALRAIFKERVFG